MPGVADSWWASRLEDRLSQGDILPPVLVGAPTNPPKFLQRGPTQRGNIQTWPEAPEWTVDVDDAGFYVAKGRHVPSIVLNHSCELDKVEQKRVLVAPVFPIDQLDESTRELVLKQKRFALMPLPDVPNLGTSYADLRCIVNIDRKTAGAGKRLASMSELGVKRLQVQLIAFFARTEL